MLRDLGYAVRVLIRNPVFAITAIISMAAGIAACTAVLSLIYALLLRPLAVPRGDELVSLYGWQKSKSSLRAISLPDYRDLAIRTDVFEGVGAYFRYPVVIAVGDDGARGTTELASGNYHAMLGVRPALGRMLRSEDDRFGAPRVVVLSARFWTQRFGASRDVLGRSIRLNGTSYEIVGVAPPSFTGVLLDWYGAPDTWVPLSQYSAISKHLGRLSPETRRDFPWLQVTARLRPGVHLETAAAALELRAAELAREYPTTNRDVTFTAFRSSQARFWPGRRGVMIDFAAVLFAVVAVLLLIALLNVTNLLLARLTTRAREISIRLAIGASRIHLARQLLIEALVLSGVATLVSLPLSGLLTWGIAHLTLPFFITAQALDLSPDWRVFSAVAVLYGVCSLILGAAPISYACRAAGRVNGRDGSAARGTIARTWDARHTLAALQIAVCLMLTLGAGLLGKRLIGLMHVDLGFTTDRVTLIELETYMLDYSHEQNAAFYRQLLTRVRQLPGVEAAAVATNVLPSPMITAQTIAAPDADDPTARQGFSTRFNVVGADYFATVEMPIVAGRPFDTREEDATTAQTAILNETAARRLWQQPARAIGQRLSVRNDKNQLVEREVVGVVRDAVYGELDEAAAPYLFLPVDRAWAGGLTLHVRGPRDPDQVIARVRREVRLLDPAIAISAALTLNEHVASRMAAPRLAAELALVTSASGVILAMLGLYAVLAYLVAQRRTELAIRMSIGAAPQQIVRFIAAFGARIVAVGGTLGLAGSFLASRLVQTHLAGTDTHDPIVYVAVVPIVLLAAVGACLLPARRAARLEPWGILRR